MVADDIIKDSTVSQQAASGRISRPEFTTSGRLNGTQDMHVRAINNTSGFLTFSFAKDFGSIKSTPNPFIVAFGRSRTPMVQVVQANTTAQMRYPLHLCNGTRIPQLVSDLTYNFVSFC